MCYRSFTVMTSHRRIAGAATVTSLKVLARARVHVVPLFILGNIDRCTKTATRLSKRSAYKYRNSSVFLTTTHQEFRVYNEMKVAYRSH